MRDVAVPSNLISLRPPSSKVGFDPGSVQLLLQLTGVQHAYCICKHKHTLRELAGQRLRAAICCGGSADFIGPCASTQHVTIYLYITMDRAA